MRLGLSASRPVTAPVVPRHLSASAHPMLLVHTPLLQRRAATPATWGVAMEVPDLWAAAAAAARLVRQGGQGHITLH